MFRKIRNLLFYAGTERTVYNKIRYEILDSNISCLFWFSMISFCGMSVMLTSSFFVESLIKNRSTYLFASAISLLIFFLSKKYQNNEPIIYILIYIFNGMLLRFGIILGTIVDPHNVTVSFIILLFAIPLLFTDRPIRMILIVLSSIVVYFLFAARTQTVQIIGFNATNVIPYGIISIIVGTYMMQVKIQRLILVAENRYLSEFDQLTGLLNRRSFHLHVQRLQNSGKHPDLKICALDINSLKTVNDTLGHKAGDELIIGAADCIRFAFQQYGQCYRIGGDEFMVLIDGPSPSEEELRQILQHQTSLWKGILVSDLSISVGIISASPEHTIEDLVHAADMKMYADKAAYYAQRA